MAAWRLGDGGGPGREREGSRAEARLQLLRDQAEGRAGWSLGTQRAMIAGGWREVEGGRQEIQKLIRDSETTLEKLRFRNYSRFRN